MARDREDVAEATIDGSAEASDHEATSLGDDLAGATIEHADLVSRGRKIGRYVVIERLGSGSMGTVYRAYDPELDRGVAVKLVAIKNSRWRKVEEIRARLMREAQAIARVQHPNVVHVYDVGDVGFAVWVAMEFVEGRTLKAWARAEPRPWRQVLEAFVQAGRGLAAAHRADIVHRDFKPDNAMIGADGRVRVLDFGLARALSGPTTRESSRAELADLEDLGEAPLDAALTAHGIVVGTPAYMAPEQHTGGIAGPASDQFAFCVSLWEALYGQRPFAGDTHAVVAYAATRGRITPPPGDRSVPRWVHAIVLRGLAVDPSARFPTMDALVEALERDPARRRRRIAAGVAVAAAIAGAAVLARAFGPPAATPVCEGMDDRLAGVWDDARRHAVSQAFDATGLPYAADATASVTAIVDDWTARWVVARTDACAATQLRGEQSSELMDLRMACLDRAWIDLGALVAVLVEAERATVQRATEAASALPELSACSDIEHLTARVPPPTDPQRKQAFDALTEELAELRARVNAGAYAGSAARIEALHDPVVQLDHPPVTADYHGLAAQVQLATGKTPEARSSWERVLAQAVRGGDTRKAAFAGAKLVFIVGHKLSDPGGGERWADITREIVRAVPDEGVMLASLWSAEGSMYTMAGQYDRALETLHRVRDFWLARDPDSAELALAYGNLGTVHVQRGEYDEAIRLHELEAAAYRKRFGAHHPETGMATSRLAGSYSHAGRFDEARPMFERAIEILRASQGQASIEIATALDGLGRVLRQQGELDRAVAIHREALAAWRAEMGDDHPDVGVSLMNVGYTLAAQKKWSDALAVFDEAAGVLERGDRADHPFAIYVANARGQMLAQLDRYDDARAVLERALTLDAVDQVDPTLIAETKFALAVALWAANVNRERALALAREAADAYRAGPAVWADDLAKIDAWLAERTLQR